MEMMRLLLCAVLATLLLAVPAQSAEMEVGMQDDNTIIHGYRNRLLALEQFKAMGGTTVRINLEHARRSSAKRRTRVKGSLLYKLKLYDSAIDTINSFGLKPQITLVWRPKRGNPDPIRVGKWMRNVARHFRGRVSRFSVFNEPDLYLYGSGACNRAGQARFIRRNPGRTFLYRGRYRAYDATMPRRKGMNLKVACLRYERGRLYRQYVDFAAPSIRKGAPRSQVLAGETSGQPGLAWFVKGARPRSMAVSGWAHHPFQLKNLNPNRRTSSWGISRTRQLKRLFGKPLYFTEFGYPHPRSSMDKRVLGRRAKPKQIARALPAAWRIARRNGVKQMLQYQWYVKPKFRKEFWETALLPKDNGKVNGAYRALRKLILGWRD